MVNANTITTGDDNGVVKVNHFALHSYTHAPMQMLTALLLSIEELHKLLMQFLVTLYQLRKMVLWTQNSNGVLMVPLLNIAICAPIVNGIMHVSCIVHCTQELILVCLLSQSYT